MFNDVHVGSATVSLIKMKYEVLQRPIQLVFKLKTHSNNLQGGIDDVDSAIRTKQYMVKSDIGAGGGHKLKNKRK